MMKFITYIFVLIVLTASLAPCFDRKAYSIDGNAPTEIVTSDADQNHPAGDVCSPFCTCSCCVTSADVFSFEYKLYTPAIIPQDLPTLNQLFIENQGISFWQPPKFIS